MKQWLVFLSIVYVNDMNVFDGEDINVIKYEMIQSFSSQTNHLIMQRVVFPLI